MSKLLDAEAKSAALEPLGRNGWFGISEEDAIRKVYIFRNFVDAWSWMTAVAIWAEKLNHHPEWLNIYRTVDVKLTTHHDGGLTDLDIRLAKKMDDLAASFKSVEFQTDIEQEITCLCGLPEPE